jgi:hypothetical protein
MNAAPLAALGWSLDNLGARLLIDLVAIAILTVALFYRRHRRRDLVVLYVMFNVGLFAAVVVIGEGNVAAAVGFGLFAVLSIIRLRAEQLASAEIAYFFAAIVLGLVTAVDLGSVPATGALAALVLVAPAVIDSPRVLTENHRMEVTLEVIAPDRDALIGEVERRIGARVIALEVLDLDYVREVTRVQVRVLGRPSRGRAPISPAEPESMIRLGR